MAAFLCLTAGARHAEHMLLERLDRALEVLREDPTLLGRPVRVVVPSRSLAAHVAARWLAKRGRAVAGVEVLTHSALARTILEHAAERDPVAYPLGLPEIPAALLARRAAAELPVLERLLGVSGRPDAFGVVAGSVDDLLDAGLEPSHVEALDELLVAEAHRPGRARAVPRARALLAAAAQTARALAATRTGHATVRLRRAADALAQHGPALLPTRLLLLHGYADATGVVTDFLEALLRTLGGEAIIDLPPRPPTGGSNPQTGSESSHPSHLLRRLGSVAVRVSDPGPASVATEMSTPAKVMVLAAADPRAEMQRVAARIHRLLAAGEVAEQIGVVARDLDAYAASLRTAFDAHAVPFSAVGSHGGLDPAGRSILGFATLLASPSDLPIARWLDLVAPDGPTDNKTRGLRPALRNRLCRTFHGQGIARLGDLAAVSEPAPGDSHQPIGPVLATSATRDQDDLPSLVRRATRAAALTWRLAEATESASVATFLRQIEALLDGPLAWPASADARIRLEGALDAAWSPLPPELVLSRDEALLLAQPHLRAAARGRLGGAGGGVQVLDVTEARGRTFAHLFVVGLVRDRFPRVTPEDPLLPDPLRQALRGLLPDLGLAGRSHAAERYRFAQLLTASPDVTLTWSRVDERGRARSRSPFLRAFADVEISDEPPGAPSSFAEAARAAALLGERTRLAPWLEASFAEARWLIADDDDGAAPSPRVLARSRLAVLDIAEPRPGGVSGRLGPASGHIGPIRTRDDPRHSPPAVTTLENLAACPWRAFVHHLLGVRPVSEPLASLPGLPPAVIGVVVHRVLERIAGRSAAGEGATWPPDDELDAWLEEEAARLLREQGLAFAGLARAAAARAKPSVVAARSDWQPDLVILGAEVDLEATFGSAGGRTQKVRLRVDRIDRGHGRLRLTDYKTGRPALVAPSPAGRRKKLLEAVATGRGLQAAVGLEAALKVPAWSTLPIESRFVYLRPDLDHRQRVVSMASGDRALRDQLAEVLAVLAAGWQSGVFFPRTSEPDEDVEPRPCRSCSVRDACQRGDSGARRRLRAWAEAAATTDAEAAARALWRLGQGSAGR